MNVVNRISVILDLFLTKGNNLSLTNIVAETGYNKTTTHRLLAQMMQEGFIAKDPETNHYSIGVKLFELGMLYYRSMDLVKIAHSFLTDLATDFKGTSFLCVYDSASMDGIFLERVEWKYYFKDVMVWQGGRLPMNCGAAPLALLAAFPDEEVKKIIKEKGLTQLTEKSLATEEELFSELSEIRSRGYSLTKEDISAGLASVGAPIYGPDEKVIASISLSGTVNEYEGATLQERVKRVLEAAAILTVKMGGSQK